MVAANPLIRKIRRLEDARCFRTDIQLRKELDRSVRAQQARDKLSAASGIDDLALLDRMLELGITAATFPALELAPIVMVAWASGDVSEKENRAAFQTILDSELARHAEAVELFETWLNEQPGAELLSLWAEVARQRLANIRRSIREAMGDRLLKQATDVALASGGILGFGSICQAERQTLDLITDVYGL